MLKILKLFIYYVKAFIFDHLLELFTLISALVYIFQLDVRSIIAAIQSLEFAGLY